MKLKKSVGVYVFLFAALLIASNVAIYYLAKDNITGYAVTDSQVGNLSAGIQTYVACTWSDDTLSVNFGNNLDPGQNDVNATKNYNLSDGTAYNVTISPISNVNVDVTMKGADLVSGANKIAVGNVTWVSNDTDADGANMIPSNSVSLETDYDAVNKLAANKASGETAHFRFWIDIPSGQVAGNYEGNFTQQCAQAA